MKITRNALRSASLAQAVHIALPEQGSVEIQRDAPGKAHTWHEHPVDETILMLEGRLRFMHGETETLCLPGDAIFLPARTRHGSVALQEGAVYLIALRRVEFA